VIHTSYITRESDRPLVALAPRALSDCAIGRRIYSRLVFVALRSIPIHFGQCLIPHLLKRPSEHRDQARRSTSLFVARHALAFVSSALIRASFTKGRSASFSALLHESCMIGSGSEHRTHPLHRFPLHSSEKRGRQRGFCRRELFSPQIVRQNAHRVRRDSGSEHA